MRMIKLSAIVLVFISLSTGAFAGTKQPEVIQLHSGPVSGKMEEGTRIFLGIPYAAPPVGSLRWKPPVEIAPWKEVRKATEFAPSCPQPDEKEGSIYSEDCLYLNVWTPAKRADEKLPVMVWIHGGGFNFGSTSLPEYNGRNLAEKGVVVVTVNYRLGPLGFLVHPLLSQESSHGVSGNYGLLDQIAALQWVRKNIAAFGGNPELVTIFGQSAGSRSVSLQMISPLSEGLFQRAIAQSGGPIIGSEYLSTLFTGNMANVAEMGERLATRLGCDTKKDELAAMRAKSAEEVVKAADCKTGLFDDSGLFFAPVFDGWVLPCNPMTVFSAGQQHDVPIIVGSTLNEGNIYLVHEKDLTLAKYHSFLESRFEGNVAQASALFPALEEKKVGPAIDRLITVGANAEPARLVARAMERMNSKAFLYRFTRLPDTPLARRLGVHHGVDLAYTFGNMSGAEGYDKTDFDLSRKMMEYWTNFARTGDPNRPGLPEWPAYESSTDINLEFADTIHINNHLYEKECDFIRQVSMFQSQQERNKEVKISVDPHSANMRFHFQDQEMDFVFGSVILGAAINRGCEIGEAFRTAAAIKDGDAASWQEEWTRTARLVEARGEASLAKGHKVSAREQLQRASFYYRASLISMLPDDALFRQNARKSRELLKKAGELMNPPLEYIEISFEGIKLPGYFRKASSSLTPEKTLIAIGGAETFMEDMYFYVAPQAHERGYNFLTIDLPGQGLLPLEGKFFRHAMDIPIKTVVDYALERPDVDPLRLAVYGISSGGGFVPQAAMHDKRIKAIAMNNCVFDAHAGVAKMAIATATADVVKTWPTFKLRTNQAIAWRFGLKYDDLPGLVRANEGFSFDPAMVDVPSLDIVANGEYQSPEIQRQTKICMEGLKNPQNRLVITPAEEGASNHCVMENRSLMGRELFDWLDEVFN